MNYYEQMTKEVGQAVKSMSADEIEQNIRSCQNLLAAGGIDDEDREQIKKELVIYLREYISHLEIY